MSGILSWLAGFFDGSMGKYHCRQTHYRPSHFGSAHWTGLGVRFVDYHHVLYGASRMPYVLVGPQQYYTQLRGR